MSLLSRVRGICVVDGNGVAVKGDLARVKLALCGSLKPSRTPNGLGRLAQGSQTCAPQALAIRKPRFADDVLEAMMSILQHQPRRFHAQLLHGFRGGLARLQAENAAELPGTQVHDIGEPFDGKILAEMPLREGERAPNAVRFRLELKKRRMLRLAARTTMVDDELTRHSSGNVSAEVLLDHSQRKVDHRGHSGGGPDHAVLDEDAVFLYAHARVSLPKRVSILPMGRGPLPFEQAGGGQDESASASGCHAARCAGCGP